MEVKIGYSNLMDEQKNIWIILLQKKKLKNSIEFILEDKNESFINNNDFYEEEEEEEKEL